VRQPGPALYALAQKAHQVFALREYRMALAQPLQERALHGAHAHVSGTRGLYFLKLISH
jgi:hypothetical protein